MLCAESERFVLTVAVPYNSPLNNVPARMQAQSLLTPLLASCRHVARVSDPFCVWCPAVMNRVDLDIARYCAWAPGVESAADWARWADAELAMAEEGSPPLDFLPALFRRRLSRLSRMALKVAHDCGGDDPNLATVFCSRHGELTRTKALLLDQARGEPLSPTAFSMSVHNTASGLYSIASGNTAPSNAVAAMADSLPVALMDAAAVLASGRATRIMVVVAEEPIGAPYQNFVAQREFAFAAAFLLVTGVAANDGDITRLTLTFGAQTSGRCDGEQQGLALLRFLHRGDGAPSLVLAGERLQWVFATS